MWGPGPQQVGSPVWLTGSGRAVNVLRALMGFFPLHLLWDFKIILLFLFKFFTSFFQSQQLHHRSAGGSSPSDLESVGPAGTMDLSFSFLVPGTSGEVQSQEIFGPGTAQPPASA